MKKIGVIVAVVFIAEIMLLFSLISSCGDGNPKRVEGKVWTYYVLSKDKIALVGINENAVPDDGVLYIPYKIDGRMVSAFSVDLYRNGVVGYPHTRKYTVHFNIPFMNKITFADGLPMNENMWEYARIFEFEATNPSEEFRWCVGSQKNIIVPDGCRNVYADILEAQDNYSSKEIYGSYVLIEKSESFGLDYLIDKNGVLLAYYGLNQDKLVFPSGIKKIYQRSFNFWTTQYYPRTVILNEDLEEIEEYGLSFNIEEISIPKSVKFIGYLGVFAKRIYLYRSTELHHFAFGSEYIMTYYPPEIIYLD